MTITIIHALQLFAKYVPNWKILNVMAINVSAFLRGIQWLQHQGTFWKKDVNVGDYEDIKTKLIITSFILLDTPGKPSPGVKPKLPFKKTTTTTEENDNGDSSGSITGMSRAEKLTNSGQLEKFLIFLIIINSIK